MPDPICASVRQHLCRSDTETLLCDIAVAGSRFYIVAAHDGRDIPYSGMGRYFRMDSTRVRLPRLYRLVAGENYHVLKFHDRCEIWNAGSLEGLLASLRLPI